MKGLYMSHPQQSGATSLQRRCQRRCVPENVLGPVDEVKCETNDQI